MAGQDVKSSSKTTGRSGRIHSNSSSNHSSRRSSLTRKRSSQRLIRTISIEQDIDSQVLIQAEQEYSAFSSTSSKTSSVDTKGTSNGVVEQHQNIIPKLSSLKISNDTENGSTTKSSMNPDFIEVPFVEATLDPSLPQDYLNNDILNIIQTLRIPKWHAKGYTESPLARESLKLIKISGAMTNAIFKIQYPNLPSLLLRIYGQNNNSIIDRDYELQILARLSIRNIGPSLYGCFQNGRFEQFLENATTLTKDDIRDWNTSQRIARRMKELHMGVPLLKPEVQNGPTCWQKIDKWLDIIESNDLWTNDDSNIQRFFNCHNWEQFKSVISQYRDWLFNKNGANNAHNNIFTDHLVFCHNDAQYGNLLFNSPVIKQQSKPSDTATSENVLTPIPSTSSSTSLFPTESNILLEKIINPPRQEQIQDKKLVVIDFEYSGANPAVYDLANHFSEWMHDYSSSKPWQCNDTMFPTKEQLLNFIYSYVSHLNGGLKSSSVSTSSGNRKKNVDELEQQVRHIYNEIIRWRATVQLFWSLWAVIQSGILQKTVARDGEIDEFLNEIEGINGEKYIIRTTEEQDDSIDSIVLELDDEEDLLTTEGVSVDTFDYAKYCSDKISVFWGDMAGLEIAPADKLDQVIINRDAIKSLNVNML